MAKIYVVGRTNFEYNDEVYRETEGTHPMDAYTSKDRAKHEVLLKTIDELDKMDCLGDYGYDLDEVFNHPEAVARAMNVDIDYLMDNRDFSTRFKSLSLEKQAEVINALSIKFYRVYEVEIED